MLVDAVTLENNLVIENMRIYISCDFLLKSFEKIHMYTVRNMHTFPNSKNGLRDTWSMVKMRV
jgi:hypothetical protein